MILELTSAFDSVAAAVASSNESAEREDSDLSMIYPGRYLSQGSLYIIHAWPNLPAHRRQGPS